MRPDTRIDHIERIARVVSQIRDEPERTLSVTDIADIAALSPFHAIRVFRLITGYTPAAMQTAIRVQAAKRLLAVEGATVTDACFDVGFSSLGSFSQRFAILCGVNPSEFRALASNVDELVASLDSLDRNPVVADDERHVVSGTILGCDQAPGFFFIGLFPPGPPQGRPMHGDILSAAGDFVIRHVPDGLYTIYCAKIARPSRAQDWALPDSEYQTGGGLSINMILGTPVRDVEIFMIPRTQLVTPIMTPLMATPRIADIARVSQIPDVQPARVRPTTERRRLEVLIA